MTAFTLFGHALAPLYAAIAEVESNNGVTSPNVYQIDADGHGYTDDVNRFLANAGKRYGFTVKRHYSKADALNREDAENMMLVYWSFWGRYYESKTGKPVTYEVLARIHNGGPFGWKKAATIAYWNKVAAVMYRNAAKEAKMSIPFIRQRQESCPVVLAACERKVKAEAIARLADMKVADAEAAYAKKRGVMNELFAAGVAMRKAQVEYFKNRDPASLEKSKAAEARFDTAIQACRDLGKPFQQAML